VGDSRWICDYGESLEDAARREALEETGLSIELLCQFHTYSDPSRGTRPQPMVFDHAKILENLKEFRSNLKILVK